MVKIGDENLPRLAGIYNRGGKDALYKELRGRYGIKHPWSTLARMKAINNLGYDGEKDRFTVGTEEDTDDSLFMTMEELCSPIKPQHMYKGTEERNSNRAEAMEKMVKELIGDKLLELSRYVIMDSVSKTMLIDKTALTDAGYTLVTH